jgi:outer membrane protein
MKQELEEKYLNLERSRKDMLDSLNREYKSIINSKISDEQLQYRQDYYIQKRKEFEEDSQRIIEAYNQRIWNRINELAILYAKENNVEILFGTSGDGNIMYVDESKDISEDFVKYINNQYNGK